MDNSMLIITIGVGVLGLLLVVGGSVFYYLSSRKRDKVLELREEARVSRTRWFLIFGLIAGLLLLVLIVAAAEAWLMISGIQPQSEPVTTPSICSDDVLRRFERTELSQLVMQSVEAGPALAEDLHWQISAQGDGCVVQLHGTMNDRPMPVVYSFYIEMPDGIIYADSSAAAEWTPYFDAEQLKLPE